jgi:hypothetical protein
MVARIRLERDTVQSFPHQELSMCVHDPNEAVQMLDLLLDFFADGAHWTRGRFDDGQGGRCLIGALGYLQRKHHVASSGAAYFLKEAMPRRQLGLIYFNDHRCRSFADLRSVILEARVLALRAPEMEQAARAAERWLLIEIKRERATSAAAGAVLPTYIPVSQAPAELAPAQNGEILLKQAA